ncbi:MAG: putative motility protein [Lachnospiraceae bacterium]|jgi:hypothetical protein|nr:putative motility protein [Lachnospiraceae bacterium]
MDISGVSGINTAATMTNASSGIQRDVAVQVTSMGLDQMEQNGEALKKMMEMSVNPQVGSNFDVSV